MGAWRCVWSHPFLTPVPLSPGRYACACVCVCCASPRPAAGGGWSVRREWADAQAVLGDCGGRGYADLLLRRRSPAAWETLALTREQLGATPASGDGTEASRRSQVARALRSRLQVISAAAPDLHPPVPSPCLHRSSPPWGLPLSILTGNGRRRAFAVAGHAGADGCRSATHRQ